MSRFHVTPQAGRLAVRRSSAAGRIGRLASEVSGRASPTLNCQWRVRGARSTTAVPGSPEEPADLSVAPAPIRPERLEAVPSHEQATRSSSTVVVAGAVVDTSPRRPLSRCAHSSHKTPIDDWAGELVCLTWTDPSSRHASFLRGAQVATGLARCGIRLDP